MNAFVKVARAVPPIARVCLTVDSALLFITLPLYRTAGLSLAWVTVIPHVLLLGVLAALWTYLTATSGRHDESRVTDTLLATFTLLLATNVMSPAQYLAVTTRQPLIDPALAKADTMIGINVAWLAAWTAGHPWFSTLLTSAYFTLLPQFVVALVVIALCFGLRRRLWEYIFHFHFCAIVTVTALALFPAECAFQHLGFESTINQGRFVAHFNGLRNGALTVIRFDDLEGLVSFPSFHAAGALMVLWAFRGIPSFFIPLLAVNSLLLMATVMSGAHYFVDLMATTIMFAVSVGLHGRWFGRSIETATPEAAAKNVASRNSVPALRFKGRRQHDR